MVQLSPTPGPRPSYPSPRPASVAADPVARLAERLEVSGADPLLTWYHDRARVELSGRTVGSWLAKTVHLMAEEGIGAGDLVYLPVLADRPLHWVSCCWLLACWWSGARPSVRPEDAATAAVAVSGPDASGTDPAVPLVQCSLEPLAGPCRQAVPGAIDFTEALAMPDEMPAPTPAPAAGIWLCDQVPLTGQQLAEQSRIDEAVMVDAEGLVSAGASLRTPAARIAELLAGCLLGAGSLVLVESPPDGLSLAGLAAQEHARPA